MPIALYLCSSTAPGAESLYRDLKGALEETGWELAADFDLAPLWWGEDDALDQFAAQLNTAEAVIYAIGPSDAPPRTDGRVEILLDRWRRDRKIKILPVLLTGAEPGDVPEVFRNMGLSPRFRLPNYENEIAETVQVITEGQPASSANPRLFERFPDITLLEDDADLADWPGPAPSAGDSADAGEGGLELAPTDGLAVGGDVPSGLAIPAKTGGEALEAKFAAALKNQTIVYNKPEALPWKGAELSLIIASADLQKAQDAIKVFDGAATTDHVDLTNLVRAELKGPPTDVDITLLSDEEMDVTRVANVQWIWSVKPKQPGKTILHLRL
jgi:hypothetical protein